MAANTRTKWFSGTKSQRKDKTNLINTFLGNKKIGNRILHNSHDSITSRDKPTHGRQRNLNRRPKYSNKNANKILAN
jgi:hypothetical protein